MPSKIKERELRIGQPPMHVFSFHGLAIRVTVVDPLNHVAESFTPTIDKDGDGWWCSVPSVYCGYAAIVYRTEQDSFLIQLPTRVAAVVDVNAEEN